MARGASLRRRLLHGGLEADDPGGLEALGAGFGLVLDGFAVGEGAEALAFDHRMVNEDVLTVLFGRDESEALLVVEPLDLPSGHGPLLSRKTCGLRRGEPRKAECTA